MTSRSPFDFDVSVSGQKARKRSSRSMGGGVEESRRVCDWPGCESRAPHRAPRSPHHLNEYLWFCQDHARDYNARWDYYASMSAEEVLRSQERDFLWDRPTWKMGKEPDWMKAFHSHSGGEAWRRMGFDDPMELLGDNATINRGAGDAAERAMRTLPPAERAALETLGLGASASLPDIRSRYKELVKSLHPDLNGGDRSEEARLKDVIAAWNRLKNSARFR